MQIVAIDQKQAILQCWPLREQTAEEEMEEAIVACQQFFTINVYLTSSVGV